jgi:hypothetical protein
MPRLLKPPGIMLASAGQRSFVALRELSLAHDHQHRIYLRMATPDAAQMPVNRSDMNPEFHGERGVSLGLGSMD